MLPDRNVLRWPTLLLAGLALHAAADEREHPMRGDGYFTTQPADGQKNLQGRLPYIPAEYVPPTAPSPVAPSSGTDRPPGANAHPRSQSTYDADLALAVIRNDLPGVQALLKAGARINGTDGAFGRDAGQTPLMLAARYGTANSAQNHVLRLLLRHGANPNARTREGVTALFFAANAGLRVGNGAIDTVTELLAAGADPGMEANDGSTAIFWWAAGSIDPRQSSDLYSREAIYRDFLAIAQSFHVRGADLSHRENTYGMTALHAAAMSCNPHGVLLMQAIGIDAATGDDRLMAPKELVWRRIRDEGESRLCRHTLEALANKELVNHWKRVAVQVAPLVPAGR